jgi:hypothetical protein
MRIKTIILLVPPPTTMTLQEIKLKIMIEEEE